ncbi:MAG: hypothetical protein ABRQ23_04935 [Syntrophomonadaceae bacterium]
MAFFQDLGKKITEGVHEASEKASEMVEITKINSAISKEKDAINEAKQQIGDKVYGMFKAGTALPEGLAEDFQNIDTHLQKIAEFEAKIASLKE